MTASRTAFTATFANGFVATRTSEAAYTHASLRFGAKAAKFHTSEAAARKAAGMGGQVVAVEARQVGGAAPAAGGCRFVIINGGPARCGAPVIKRHGSYSAACANHP